MKEKSTTTRSQLGASFRDTRGEEENRPKFAPAAEIDRAIELSCRAGGAGAWARGLESRRNFPVGASAALLLTTPNLR